MFGLFDKDEEEKKRLMSQEDPEVLESAKNSEPVEPDWAKDPVKKYVVENTPELREKLTNSNPEGGGFSARDAELARAAKWSQAIGGIGQMLGGGEGAREIGERQAGRLKQERDRLRTDRKDEQNRKRQEEMDGMARTKFGWDKTKYDHDSQSMDSSAPISEGAKTLALSEWITQIPQEDRASFRDHVSGMSADQLAQLRKFMAANKGKAHFLRTRDPETGHDVWGIGSPDGQITPTKWAAPHAKKTLKGNHGEALVYDPQTNTHERIGGPSDYNRRISDYTADELRNTLLPADRKRLEEIQDSYTKDPLVKQLRETNLRAEQLHALIERAKNGEKVSIAQFKPAMARLGGEVGALTEADKEGQANSSAWLDRFGQFFQTGIEGNLTDENIEYIEGALGALKYGLDSGAQSSRAHYLDKIQKMTPWTADHSNMVLGDFFNKAGESTTPPGSGPAPKQDTAARLQKFFDTNAAALNLESIDEAKQYIIENRPDVAKQWGLQ